MRWTAALVALSALVASYPASGQVGYYYDHAGNVAQDPTVAAVYAAYARAAAAAHASMTHPADFVAAHGRPLVQYVHPSAMAAMKASNPYAYGGAYSAYPHVNPHAGKDTSSAFYNHVFTASLPHVAHVDVAPVIASTGADATKAVASATEAVRNAVSESGSRAQAAAARDPVDAAKAAAAGDEESDAAKVAAVPHVEEVETEEIPRCFVCDRAEEECRLECKVGDEAASGFGGYRFDARRFAGEDWWQERTQVTSIPRVNPRTVSRFCSVTIGGSGSFRAEYMRAFHAELCLMARLVKRPDLLTKFQGVVEHAFRRAVDTACSVSDPSACLPARLEAASCPGTCSQCETAVTAAINAATGGDVFDTAAFERVMGKQLSAVGVDAAAPRSVRAAARRARELHTVSMALTGRSDRDRLVIVEHVCGAYGSPSCGCTLSQEDAPGAGESDGAEGNTQDLKEAAAERAEGLHVADDEVLSAAEEEQEEGGAGALDGVAMEKKGEVSNLEGKAKEIEGKIAQAKVVAKEAEAAAKEGHKLARGKSSF